MNFRSSSEDDEVHIDLTSLIDVVFMLLIFFMVTTTFVKDASLKIRLPEANAQPSQSDNKGVRVAIDKDGRYLVNDKALIDNKPGSLQEALRSERGDQSGTQLIVRADGQASHQSVVTLMDVAGQLGFADIVIETTRPAQEP